MVGFNRRFAPLLVQMKKSFGTGSSTSVTRYLVNAGPLDASSWYSNEEAQGSRFAGEGGHFIDTLSWWAESLPEEVYAVRGPRKDDVHATVRFANGSCGSIAYLTDGNSRYPKETLDATGGGRNARLDNFRSTEVWAGRRRSTAKARGGQDKGQRSEIERFVEAVTDRRPDANRHRFAGGYHERHSCRWREPPGRPTGACVVPPPGQEASAEGCPLTLLSTTGYDHLPEIWCRCKGGPHGFLRIATHAYAAGAFRRGLLRRSGHPR